MKRVLNFLFKIIFSRTMIVILMILAQLAVYLAAFSILRSYQPFFWELMNLFGGFLIIYIINRDEPTEFKLTWIIPICLFPVLGALIYMLVICNTGGIGLKKRVRAEHAKMRQYFFTKPETIESLEKISPRVAGLSRFIETRSGYPTYTNSEGFYYPLGDDMLEDFLAALRGAQRFIFIEYFIIDRGFMWDAVLRILRQKVAEGVEVRVMYDGMCSVLNLPYHYPKTLQKMGIKAKMFAPIRPFLSTSQNNRDHRKIVVIDGRVAFTGGVNIADEYINRKAVYGHWKDVAIKLKGDAVRSFTLMFLQLWNLYEAEEEKYDTYLDVSGEIIQRAEGFVIPYGEEPVGMKEVAKTIYLNLISCATRYVHIMTPYFVVDREFVDALRFAAQRGVDVEIMLPHIPDKKIVFYIARTFYTQLMEAGIKIYEYTPGFIHAKIFVVDDTKAVVGTVNLDYRSFYHHFECGAYFYRTPVVQAVKDDFEKTRERCQLVTQEYYKQIPVFQKFLGQVFKVFGPLM